jgi:hypothetical protein
MTDPRGSARRSLVKTQLQSQGSGEIRGGRRCQRRAERSGTGMVFILFMMFIGVHRCS